VRTRRRSIASRDSSALPVWNSHFAHLALQTSIARPPSLSSSPPRHSRRIWTHQFMVPPSARLLRSREVAFARSVFELVRRSDGASSGAAHRALVFGPRRVGCGSDGGGRSTMATRARRWGACGTRRCYTSGGDTWPTGAAVPRPSSSTLCPALTCCSCAAQPGAECGTARRAGSPRRVRRRYGAADYPGGQSEVGGGRGRPEAGRRARSIRSQMWR